MKRLYLFLLVLIFLPACTETSTQATPGTMATSPANLPNPAAVYCQETGNRHEIQTAADGSQFGLCIFPDGSSCDEWAYYRGECGPESQSSLTQSAPTPTAATPAETGEAITPGSVIPPETTEEVVDWWGVIRSMAPGAQFDDYFERQDLGQVISFGIDSLDPEIKSQIEVLRDSGKIVHLYGTLLSNVPDYNGSQVQVTRIEVDE